MDDVISIVKTRNSEVEFDINISGANKKEPDVRFVIENEDISYSFVCRNLENDKWLVNIPPLEYLTKSAYPFRLEIVVDGYYFEPYRGTVNVTNEPEVTSGEMHMSRPAAPTVTVTPTDLEPKEEDEEELNDENVAFDGTKEEPDLTTDTEDELDNLADILLQNKRERVKDEVKEPVTEKDKAVHNAIVDFMKKPFQSKKKDVLEQNEDEVIAAAMKETEKHVKEVTTPRKSNLTAVIKDMNEEPELSEQALKVRAILSKG